MKLKDQFRFVRQNMKKNKTRLFMTILATAMGCAFLIVLASVGFGLHKTIIKGMTEDRAVTEIEVPGKEEGKGVFLPLTDKDIKYFESIDNVKAVTRRQVLMQQGSYEIGNYQTSAETIVTHVPSEIKAGFELSKGRLPEADHEVVVGHDFVESLANKDAKSEELYDETSRVKEEFKYKEDLVGKQLSLTVMAYVEGQEQKKMIPLTVVGIGKKPGREWMFDQNVFISEKTLSEIEEFTGTPRGTIKGPGEEETPESDSQSYDYVKIYATNLEAVQAITDSLKKENYPTYSVVSEMKEVNKVFTVIKAGLIFVGTIAILIASIGIYNTMTMAVTERAPDIGIMKAIGANPGTIKRIFLLESSYIGIVGAVIGTIVSYGLSYIVNYLLPIIISSSFGEELPEGLMFSYIPVTLPLICVIICYAVTILSGYRPAQRATRVDVLKALRREV
ncbi:ABC transporter permease [Bacillus canaveralius]|uniref:ABC transporter permease n=1 Tax=Bacillus canaveralius TaxID=1403243 RepID=UPI000F78104F|nr:FtsX-like permease family protein [Bacillus canaveralius]RSK52940.1 ABC transporter permease [Bacillus canaveralius]